MSYFVSPLISSIMSSFMSFHLTIIPSFFSNYYYNIMSTGSYKISPYDARIYKCSKCAYISDIALSPRWYCPCDIDLLFWWYCTDEFSIKQVISLNWLFYHFLYFSIRFYLFLSFSIFFYLFYHSLTLQWF